MPLNISQKAKVMAADSIAWHDADDIQTLLQLIGSPALPRPYDRSQFILAGQRDVATNDREACG
jgi:hypothetical protein